jgi:hypothetical protein
MGTSIDPKKWGWELRDSSYEPIRTDLEAAPEHILKFVRCKCKLSTKNPCGTNTCTCKKNGLKCMAACGNCYGNQCNNREEIIANEQSSDDDNIDADDNIFNILENF